MFRVFALHDELFRSIETLICLALWYTARTVAYYYCTDSLHYNSDSRIACCFNHVLATHY